VILSAMWAMARQRFFGPDFKTPNLFFFH
jgi:hypothetical protein